MAIIRGNSATTCFLNVDLDIYSKVDLEPLVSALGNKVIVLYVGRIKRSHCAHLELTRITKNADATIRAFCSLLEALPESARNLWNSAKVRDFSIGVQAGMKPHSTDFVLAVKTLKAAHQVGARIVFTVYAPEPPRNPAAKARTGLMKAAGARPKPVT